MHIRWESCTGTGKECLHSDSSYQIKQCSQRSLTTPRTPHAGCSGPRLLSVRGANTVLPSVIVQCFASHFSCFWLVTAPKHPGSHAVIYRSHEPSLFLVRSWGPQLCSSFREKCGSTPSRLMISAFPFLKLTKSIFYKHDVNLKHHQINTEDTYWKHILMVLFALESYEPRTIKLKRDF